MSIAKQIHAFLQVSEAFFRQSGTPMHFFPMPRNQHALEAIDAHGNEVVCSGGNRACGHTDMRILNDVLAGSGAAISNDERRTLIG
jgi:hypothetical protein